MTASPVCLLIDASCDVPAYVLQHPQVRLMPVSVVVAGHKILDERDEKTTLDFYQINLNSPKVLDAHSEPLSVEEMAQFMLDHTALAFDRVLGVFVASTRSPIFERAVAAMDRVRASSFAKRVAMRKLVALEGKSTDSLALFAGYGAQAMTLLDTMTQENAPQSLTDLEAAQRKMAAQTYAYLAPGDVNYVLKRAKAKGENSVGMMAGLAAKALSITPIIRGHMGHTQPIAKKRGAGNARELLVDLATNCLTHKVVLSKHICFSYSCALDDVRLMESFQALNALANRLEIQVHLTHMSMTGSVNVGPNSLSVGFLAKAHDASDWI